MKKSLLAPTLTATSLNLATTSSTCSLGSEPPSAGRLLHLGAVLVGAGEEEDVVAQLPVEARRHVGGRRRVGVPDVRHVVDVVDGSGDVEPAHSPAILTERWTPEPAAPVDTHARMERPVRPATMAAARFVPTPAAVSSPRAARARCSTSPAAAGATERPAPPCPDTRPPVELAGSSTSTTSPFTGSASFSATWAAVPRTTSSCSLVSSRHTPTCRSGHRSATAVRVARIRRGDSNATTVASARSALSTAVNSFFLTRGRNPTNTKRSVGSPDATSAVETAEGPGSTVNSRPSAAQARTSLYPGSDNPGMPASVTSATSRSSRNNPSTGSTAASSLCSWKLINRGG